MNINVLGLVCNVLVMMFLVAVGVFVGFSLRSSRKPRAVGDKPIGGGVPIQLPLSCLHKDNVMDFLKTRETHRRFITADVLMLQLAYGTPSRDALIELILAFKTDEIAKALRELERMGLR